MSAEPSIRRPATRHLRVSLVPLVDVLLILLVFFMVTSTYLDLDMIPAVEQGETPQAATDIAGARATPLLIRLGADGRPAIRGRVPSDEALGRALRSALEENDGLQVIILPTASARMQDLISLMDQVTLAGVSAMRVVRLEASQ